MNSYPPMIRADWSDMTPFNYDAKYKSDAPVPQGMTTIPEGIEDPSRRTRTMLDSTPSQGLERGVAPGGRSGRGVCSPEDSPCAHKRFVRPQERTRAMGDEESRSRIPLSTGISQALSTVSHTERPIDGKLLRAYQIWTLSRRYNLDPRSFLSQEDGWQNVKVPDFEPTEEELDEFRRFMSFERRKKVSVWRKIYPP